MGEKEFKDFSKSAKRGISRFSGLTSSNMRKFGKKFTDKTGKSHTNVNNKEDFFEFVDRNRLRRRAK